MQSSADVLDGRYFGWHQPKSSAVETLPLREIRSAINKMTVVAKFRHSPTLWTIWHVLNNKSPKFLLLYPVSFERSTRSLNWILYQSDNSLHKNPINIDEPDLFCFFPISEHSSMILWSCQWLLNFFMMSIWSKNWVGLFKNKYSYWNAISDGIFYKSVDLK